jgi:hypothetical protein
MADTNKTIEHYSQLIVEIVNTLSLGEKHLYNTQGMREGLFHRTYIQLPDFLKMQISESTLISFCEKNRGDLFDFSELA